MTDGLSEDDRDKLDWPPFVPPYLDKDWRLMRARLNLAAAHAVAAAEASTLEDVTLNLGAASMSLIDADFIRRKLERIQADAE